jgi:phosphoribosylglycinamide formyltransferase-1
MKPKIRIGALISGGGTNLQAIIDACESGGITGKMVFVGSDNPGAGGLKRAEKAGIPTFVVDYRAIIQGYQNDPTHTSTPPDFNLEDCLIKQHIFSESTPAHRIVRFLVTRAIAEARLMKHMKVYPFDLLVLAGFMRNLTPYFIDRVNTVPDHPRILNIHPALLPAFPGTDGYGDTFRHGCRVGGCTVHFVDYGEDSGPIIGQRCFPIHPNDTLDRIKKNGLEQEWLLYPECIQLVVENRLEILKQVHTLDNGKEMTRTVVRIRTDDGTK